MRPDCRGRPTPRPRAAAAQQPSAARPRLWGCAFSESHLRTPHARDREGGSGGVGAQNRCFPPSSPPQKWTRPGAISSGLPGVPSGLWRDPGPHWLFESRASSSLGSGFPGTHPVPTPESWRPARDARRPGGRPAKFRVPLQETGSCVPGSGKPAVWAWDSLAKPPKAPGTPLQVEFLLRITSILINLLKHRCHVACRKLIKPESLLHSKNFDPSLLKRT